MVRLRPVWMTNHPPSVLWHCWLGHQTRKNRRPYNLYCVGADVKPCSIKKPTSIVSVIRQRRLWSYITNTQNERSLIWKVYKQKLSCVKCLFLTSQCTRLSELIALYVERLKLISRLLCNAIWQWLVCSPILTSIALEKGLPSIFRSRHGFVKVYRITMHFVRTWRTTNSSRSTVWRHTQVHEGRRFVRRWRRRCDVVVAYRRLLRSSTAAGDHEWTQRQVDGDVRQQTRVDGRWLHRRLQLHHWSVVAFRWQQYMSQSKRVSSLKYSEFFSTAENV